MKRLTCDHVTGHLAEGLENLVCEFPGGGDDEGAGPVLPAPPGGPQPLQQRHQEGEGLPGASLRGAWGVPVVLCL